MYDIRWIRENAEAFDRGLQRRGLEKLSSSLLALDDQRRAAIGKSQAAQERRNALSKEIGRAMGQKDLALAEQLKAEVASLKEQVPALEAEEKAAVEALNAQLAAIPNTPFDEVPDGADEHGNVLLHAHGVKPEERGLLKGVNDPKEHYELGEALGQMDFETAAKLSGSRFVVMKGAMIRLHRALAQFMLDTHTGKHGLLEVWTPVLVRDEAMLGTGQLPKFAEDSYQTTNGWWLIPTSEVTLTNLVAGRILDEAELPIRMTAHSQCFRPEAGSAGKDTAGMLRQHQFEKVEMVSITRPEDSLAELLRMTDCAQNILEALNLPYRTVVLSTGDMGFSARRTHDLEVWLPGQDTYREISSCSVCGDFQARRMNARFRRGEGARPEFVHTLNGSGLAVGRTLIAVLENGQESDGSVTLPPVLASYLGGRTRIAPDGRFVEPDGATPPIEDAI